jgi:flavin reductase (DIM6/NTAB) family NADH-FMN oxidoreductase RutF
MSVTPDELKAAMRLWASGVTVVTTANKSERAGITASTFTSVSLDPPLILVCLYNEVGTLKQIEANGHFAVSLLGSEHAHVSNQMAGYTEVPTGEDRFYGLDWITQTTGSPIYADAAAWFDCTLYALYAGGTHKIVVGEVVVVGRKKDEEDAHPLLYFSQGYRQLAAPDGE